MGRLGRGGRLGRCVEGDGEGEAVGDASGDGDSPASAAGALTGGPPVGFADVDLGSGVMMRWMRNAATARATNETPITINRWARPSDCKKRTRSPYP